MPKVNIHENVSLLRHNTFRVEAKARYFVQINTPDQFHHLTKERVFKENKDNILFLGGGSNMLLTQDRNGLVIKNNIKTMRLKNFDDETVTLTVGGGYNRHELVMFCAERERRGLENLALIPGTVGAAPIQNIGAYGVEAKDTIISVKGFDCETGNIKLLNKLECEFGYRDSIFKNELKNKFFITHVTFKLSKKANPILSYGKVKEEVEKLETISPTSIANTIIKIRNTKLPNIKHTGTAGSFFKNPIISEEIYQKLQTTFPTIKAYPANETTGGAPEKRKLSAGQLLDLCGCKGQEDGNISSYQKHALVIVNHGEKSGSKIRSFAQSLQQKVKEKTGISLEPEVNIL